MEGQQDKWFSVGFVVGTVLGLTLGLLYAPKREDQRDGRHPEAKSPGKAAPRRGLNPEPDCPAPAN